MIPVVIENMWKGNKKKKYEKSLWFLYDYISFYIFYELLCEEEERNFYFFTYFQRIDSITLSK